MRPLVTHIPRWVSVVLLLLAWAILSATVLREPLAQAAQAVDARIIGPLDGKGDVSVHEQGTASVREQNVDPGGNVKVHEQGTVAVNVTNASVPVQQAGTPITFHLSSAKGGYGVPADKRLVIEYVNALYDLGSTQGPGTIGPGDNAGMFAFDVGDHTFRFVGGHRELAPNTDDRLVSEPVTIEMGPNEFLQLDQPPSATFSGYLVDK